jgi:lysophosphatidiate acyltransferase
VRRPGQNDEAAIRSSLQQLVADKTPVWLTIFPEGTRYTPEKALESQAYARAHGLPELQHTLLPRSRGFHSSLDTLRGHISAVYDVCIVYRQQPRPEPRPPGVNMLQFLGGASQRLDIMIVRHDPSTIPSDPEGARSAGFARDGRGITRLTLRVPRLRPMALCALSEARRVYPRCLRGRL